MHVTPDEDLCFTLEPQFSTNLVQYSLAAYGKTFIDSCARFRARLKENSASEFVGLTVVRHWNMWSGGSVNGDE